MDLKTQILNSCPKCFGKGFDQYSSPCTCLLTFRAYNRMVSKGFSKKTLDLVTDVTYRIPYIETGEQFVTYYAENPNNVEANGLGLYIYSKDKGRGKTTLSHYLVFKAVNQFFDKEVYRTDRTYGFIHVEDLIDHLKEEVQDPIWKSTWLVLDDLGNEDKSASWKKSFLISNLQRIFHYRRDRNLPTIITSNYAPSNLSSLYNGELDSLLEVRPDGSIGGITLREVCVGGGEDLRLLNDYSSWPI